MNDLAIVVLGASTFFALGFAYGYITNEMQEVNKWYKDLMNKIKE